MLNELIEQLFLIAERRYTLDKGAYLFHQDDPVELFFVVEKGELELVRPQQDGKPIILQRANHHTILAEASLYSENYHCDAFAILESRLAVLDKSTFLKRLCVDTKLSRLWSTHLATEVQKARYRSEIISRKTVAERLDMWLDLWGHELPPKGEWKRLAVEVAVSPEALYRELSRRS